MTTPRLVLASGSPARLRLLRDAGITPEVIVSGVDEDDVDLSDPAAATVVLARRKARAVRNRLAADHTDQELSEPTVVLGCDSLFDLDGEALGKPASSDDARARWHAMRGRSAVLHTGHCVIRLGARDGDDEAEVSAVASTTVHFGTPSDEEIERYVATGEPLAVAGGATLDGYSAPFIDGVDGDPSNVIGLSLPLLRRLLAEVGIAIVDLWDNGR